MVEGLVQSPRPLRADAWHRDELVDGRLKHRVHAPESREERAGADDRDARHHRERGLGGRDPGRDLGTLRVGRPIG
jgi:hypothetical protein